MQPNVQQTLSRPIRSRTWRKSKVIWEPLLDSKYTYSKWEQTLTEHISLEEISSDSADEVLNKTQKKAKKKSKVMGSVTKAADSNTNNGTGEREVAKWLIVRICRRLKFIFSGKKEYSVLELLELQARARAIRSQLALEPVTKIELDDSDADNGDESLTIVPTPTADCASGATAQTGVTTIANEAEATAKPRPGIEELTESSPSVSAVRPIRLKRNFRKRPTDEDEQKVGTEPSDNQKADSAEPTASDAVNSNTNNDAMPDSSKQRSPSPDIIPIIKEPEILCISSGDESETDTDRNSYIKLPTVMKENRPQTEDELFLRKVKENALCRSGVNASADNVSSQANSNGSGEKTTDAIAKDSEMPALTPESKTDDQSAATVQLEQPEDGEILDDDDDDDVDDQPKESTKIVDLDESSNSSSESDSSRSSRSSGSSHSSSSSQSNNGIKGREAEKLETKIEAVVSTSDEVDSKHENTEQSITVADEEEDNDIIDLGKDEDLDFELINTSESTPKKRKTSKDADVPQVPTNRDVSILPNNCSPNQNHFWWEHYWFYRAIHGAQDGCVGAKYRRC